MKLILLIFSGLVLATALVTLLILYVRYRSTPAYQWKKRVQAAVAEQESRLRDARHEMNQARTSADDDELRKKYLIQHLQGLTIEVLVRYPGIGPVTVERLRKAGLSNIADCSGARLSRIAGIGRSREADLRDALRLAAREAEARFDAGACPEAVAYGKERNRLETIRAQRSQEARFRAADAEWAIQQLHDRAAMAARVTFLGHLFGHQPYGLSEEMMNQPLTVSPRERELPTISSSTQEADSSRRMEDQRNPDPILSRRSTDPESVERKDLPFRVRADSDDTVRPETAVILPTTTPLDRLRTITAFGMAIARADGRIAAAERRQIRAFLERRYAPTPDLSAQIDALMKEAESARPTVADVIWEVRRTIPQSDWSTLYQFARSVADASGEQNAREIECLVKVAEELSVETATFARRSGEVTAERSPDSPPISVAPGDHGPLSELECRADLEIETGTPLSVDLVRRQYRLLTERFDPAKFAAHGPEFIRMAFEKRARAERAARHLVAEYNEPLEAPDLSPPPSDPRHNPDLDAVFGV